MGVNSLPKTVTRQRSGCDLNPGPSAPESSMLTTWLPSHLKQTYNCYINSQRTNAHVVWWTGWNSFSVLYASTSLEESPAVNRVCWLLCYSGCEVEWAERGREHGVYDDTQGLLRRQFTSHVTVNLIACPPTWSIHTLSLHTTDSGSGSGSSEWTWAWNQWHPVHPCGSGRTLRF